MKTDETVIKCSARLRGEKTEWKTYIKHIDFYHSYYKAVIEDDESIFNVIVGHTDEYNWISGTDWSKRSNFDSDRYCLH